MKGVPYEKYMTACLSAFIEPGATILDIGTNVGTVSLPLSRLRDATVVSFEPFPETFAVLFKNIIQNRAYNIVPIRMCVGDKWRKEITLSDTVVVLPHYQDKTGAKPQIVDLRKDVDVIHFGAVGIGKGKVKAPMTSVDDLHLNISAMKVDVEGAEPMVFYGAKETIKRCMPVIVFERNEKIVSDDMKNVLGISDAIANFEIVDYCRTLGYKDFYELDIQDYMLVPPGRKQYETHSIAKFRPTTLIKGFSPKETMGYNLYRFTRPKWGKNE
jgi:FkbM family methyltransferase